MTDVRPLERQRAPSLVPIVNRLVLRLLAAGLPLGPNVQFTVRGRASGLPRTFPIGIIRLDNRRFVLSPYGQVNWVHNLRAFPSAVITKGSHREAVEAVELSPEQAAPVLRAALAPYLRSPLMAPLVRLLVGIRRDSSDEELLAQARSHPIFELRPEVDLS
jgi:deazaflavin-dependent oxidoreductase (nitroreductase family)